MATYVPNATQTTEPVESRTVESAALEFRTLKTSVLAQVASVQNELDATQLELDVTQAELDADELRITALEQLAFNGSTPGTVVINKFIATASQAVFTLNVTPLTVATVDVYINGVYQNHDSFSLAANVVTLNEGVIVGAEVEIQASIALQLGITDAALVEYQPAGSGAVATTVQAKLRESVSVLDFGAVGDGATDDTDSVQKAINYVHAAGGGTVLLSRAIYGLGSGITLKAGVFLVGQDGSDYYAGLQYYADTNDATFGTRLKALPTFPAGTDLITLDVDAAGSTRRRRSRGMRNMIADANKYARNALRCTGDSTDMRTNFDMCSFQGSTSHGIYLANAVAFTFTNFVVSANNGFGIYADYGVSDSTFNIPYIHTNQLGGLYFGDGSLFNQIIGGKVEDNYNQGLISNQSGASSTITIVNGTTFQNNNGANFVANGTDAQIFLIGVRSQGAAVTGVGGATDAHCYTSGGVIDIKSSYFDTSADYAFSSINSGTITVGADTIYLPGAVAGTYQATGGLIRFPNALYGTSGKLPLKNRGGRKQLVGIATSSSASVTFTGAFEGGLGANYFDSANYLLIVGNAPYSGDLNSRIIGVYVLSIAGTGGAVGSVGVVLTSPAPDATIITSVSAAVSGGDITVTVATGATHATGGRSSIINVQLVDIGQNMFGIEG